MRILLIFMTVLLLLVYPSAHSSDTNTLISIDKQWKFCPIDSYQPNIDTADLECHTITLPSEWEKIIPNYDGFGLLYTQFSMPEIDSLSMNQSQMGIYIHRIRDADKVFINGHLIGQTGEFPPEFEKAVFYSRLYPIDLNVINKNASNEIKIWVFNDARPGGIVSDTPKIGNYSQMVSEYYKRNFIIFSLIIILGMFSLFNFINFLFNIKSRENLFYGLFLISWAGYLFTGSDLIILSKLPLNMIFRINVILFFTIFSSFLLFIYAFFKQRLSHLLKVILFLVLICIPISLFVKDLKHLYFLVEFVEILSIPTMFYVFWLFYTVIRAKLPYAKIMSFVLSLYILFGVIEIFLDYFYANEAATYSPIGSWVLFILSLAMAMVVGHKNMSYFQKATYDSLTQSLRFDIFVERLQRLFSRAERDKKLIVTMMIDLDNFKQINDKYGHMQGDKVLIAVNKTIRHNLRHFDLLARYGGDEFCVAVMLENSEDIKILTERIHNQINQDEISINDNKTIHISVTIGAIVYNPLTMKTTPVKLVESADELLIKSKVDSKGSILWSGF